MLRSQRILLLLSLPFFALVLHLMLCEWHHGAVRGVAGGIVVFNASPAATTAAAWPTAQPPRFSGIFSRGNRDIAVLLGVITPLLLLVLDVYLFLGWRYKSRLARGLCPSCRYSLQGNSAADPLLALCPECGWSHVKAHDFS